MRGIVFRSIQGQDFFSDALPKYRHPSHVGILVPAMVQVVAYPVQQAFGGRKIGEPLGEVNGTVCFCEGRHHGKNRGAHIGKFGWNQHIGGILYQ